MKNIVACCSTFPVKLICCIAFGSVSSACCLLKLFVLINAVEFLAALLIEGFIFVILP